jgi:hypothetical protein
MNNKTTEYVLASAKTLTVWDMFSSRERAEERLPEVLANCLRDVEKFKANHIKYGYGDHDPNYWLKQANKAEVQAGDYRVMTFDEYLDIEADQLLSRPIEEITEEKFDEMLNILPPMRWGSNNGIHSFFMCEFWSGNYTQQYAKIGSRFFCKLVNYRKPETWISRDMVTALDALKDGAA